MIRKLLLGLASLSLAGCFYGPDPRPHVPGPGPHPRGPSLPGPGPMRIPGPHMGLPLTQGHSQAPAVQPADSSGNKIADAAQRPPHEL